MSNGVRGTVREGKGREPRSKTPEEPREEEVLLVVALTDDRLNAELRRIEEGLVECVTKALAENDANTLIKLHVHLAKIAARKRDGGSSGKPRNPVLPAKEAKRVVGLFGEGAG